MDIVYELERDFRTTKNKRQIFSRFKERENGFKIGPKCDMRKAKCGTNEENRLTDKKIFESGVAYINREKRL